MNADKIGVYSRSSAVNTLLHTYLHTLMQWTVAHIKTLTHQQLESIMIDFFKSKGYRVKNRRINSNRNIDFYLYSGDGDIDDSPVAVVQCIAAGDFRVNIVNVKALYEAAQAENAELGILVNNGDYTMNALDVYANNIQLYLMTGSEVVNELNAVAK